MYKNGKILVTAVCIMLMAAGCATATLRDADKMGKLTVEVPEIPEAPAGKTPVISNEQIYLLVRDVYSSLLSELELTSDLTLQSKYRIIETCMLTAFRKNAAARIDVRGYFDRGELIIMIRSHPDTPADLEWSSNALLSPLDQRPLRGAGAFLEETAPVRNIGGTIHLKGGSTEGAAAGAEKAVPADLAALHGMILCGRYNEAEESFREMCTELTRSEFLDSRDYRLTYEILALTSAIDKQEPENLVEYKHFIGE